jgi:hypothetical protein
MSVPVESKRTFQIGTPEQYRWLEGIVKLTVVLNLLDAVFTLWWVRAGFAEEANPFLRDLVHYHPTLFFVTKLTLVGLATTVFWRFRRRPLAVFAIFFGFLIYYGVLLIHIDYLSDLLRAYWF